MTSPPAHPAGSVAPASAGQRPGRRPIDAVAVLTAYLFLLVALPSDLIIGPLGAAGTPANVFGVLCLVWWVVSRLSSVMQIARGWQPIRFVMAVLAVAIVASYLAGMTRAIPHTEISSADRGVLTLMGWAGIALLASDGISSRQRLNQFIDRMVIAGALLALLGIIQYTTSWNPVALIKIPGLHANHPFGLLSERSGLKRVVGTTTHPIEYGVVMAMFLPLTLHHAFFRPERGRLHRWLPAALVIVALPMPVARSAVIGSLVALLVLIPSWPARRKLWTLLVMPVVLLAMRSALPGLLGTLKALFAYSGTDPSIVNRQADYAPAWRYITERPFFGRGFQTFLPETYRTLDNAYLGLLIEAGFVGLTALLLVQFVAIFSARGGRRRTTDPLSRDLGQSLAAAAAVPVINLATFDGLGFPMCAGMMFLIIGLCGGYWRLMARPEAIAIPAIELAMPHAGLRCRIVQAVAVLAAVLVCLPLAKWAHNAPGSYQSGSTIELTNPKVRGENPLANVAEVQVLNESVVQRLLDPATVASLRRKGATAEYRVAIGEGSLERDSDRLGVGPIVNVLAVAVTPQAAVATRNLVTTAAQSILRSIQTTVGVPQDKLVGAQVLSEPPQAGYEHGSPTRAVAAILVLLLFATPLLLLLGAAVDEALFGPRRRRKPQHGARVVGELAELAH
jgi:hypothetical protein